MRRVPGAPLMRNAHEWDQSSETFPESHKARVPHLREAKVGTFAQRANPAKPNRQRRSLSEGQGFNPAVIPPLTPQARSRQTNRQGRPHPAPSTIPAAGQPRRRRREQHEVPTSAPASPQRTPPYTPTLPSSPAACCYSKSNAAAPQTQSTATHSPPSNKPGSNYSYCSATSPAHS